MRYLTITGVEVKLTASDWELFTSKPGAEEAARHLNREFESLIRQGFSKEEVDSKMNALMETYSHLGARDTEPRYVLKQLLLEAFPYGR